MLLLYHVSLLTLNTRECPEATEECVDEFLASNVEEMAEKNKVLCTPLHHSHSHCHCARPPTLRSRVHRSSTS